MKLASAVTDQYIYFVAVDSTDFTTRETGFSSFTVYRSRNGGAAAPYTTPTVNETDSSNMPGVYELLIDEDMTIDAGDETQEICLHITHAGMAPVTRVFELFRPKITAGNTLGVAADGDVSGDVDGDVVGSVASVSGAVGSVTGAVGSVTGAVGSVAGNVDGSTASVTGAVGSVTGAVGSVTGAVGSVAGNVDGSVASVTGAVGSVTGAVGSVAGNVDGSTASIGAGGITATTLATDTITAAKIAANAITSSELADNAITAAKIATDAITAAKIAADAIGASEIAADAIGSSELATAAVNEIRDAILSDSTAFDGADIAAILTDTGTTLDTKLNDIQGGTFSSATDSLEAIRDQGDAAWTTGAGTGLTALASGTAQGGTGSTIQLATGESFGDDILNGASVKITAGTGAGQSRVITDYTGSTDTADITPDWITNPSSDSVYEVVQGSANVTVIEAGAIVAASIATNAITADKIAAAAITSSEAPNLDAAVSSRMAEASIDTTGGAIDVVTDVTNGVGLTAAAVDAIWDESTVGHVTASSHSIFLQSILDDTGTSGVVLAAGAVDATAIATGAIDADAIAADAITAAKIAPDAIGASEIAADAIGSSELATTAVNEIRDAILSDSTAFDGADIAAILTDTGTTLDTKLNDVQGATFSSATDSLEAIRDRGDAAWATGGSGLTPLASGTAQAGTASTIQLASAETFGDDILNGATVKVTSGTGAGQSRVITDYTGATDTADITPNWITNPSSDSVYEVVPGSINVTAVSNVAEDISTATALATVDGNVDTILVDTADMQPKLGSPAADISADIAAVKVDTAAVLVDTADMQPKLGTPAADVSADIAAVKVDTAATLVDTAQIGVAGAGLTDLGGMSSGMQGEVNAEVVDVLRTDTSTLPGQTAPPLAPTLEQSITWLYKVMRNRTTQTATQWSLLADDESTVDAKATVSDNGTTAIKQEIVTGP